MFRSIQPHSNPPRFTQSCSRFPLIPTDSFRFAQIHSDLLRLAQTSSNWQILKGKGKWNTPEPKREKGRRPDTHFNPDSTWITLRAARTDWTKRPPGWGALSFQTRFPLPPIIASSQELLVSLSNCPLWQGSDSSVRVTWCNIMRFKWLALSMQMKS